MRIQFLVPGEPTGKGRPRFSKAGYAYTPPKTAEYERDVKYAYLMAVSDDEFGKRFPDGAAIKANIDAVFKVPISFNKKKRFEALTGKIMPTKKPDADNIAKAVLDALNGIAYKDDSAIVECVVKKRYGEVSHVIVSLEEVV